MTAAVTVATIVLALMAESVRKYSNRSFSFSSLFSFSLKSVASIGGMSRLPLSVLVEYHCTKNHSVSLAVSLRER